VANGVRPPVLDNVLDQRDEPVNKGKGAEGWDPPPQGEFTQLKCTSQRPEILDRRASVFPTVIANDHFGRLRR